MSWSGGGGRGGGGFWGPVLGMLLLFGAVFFVVMWPLSLWGHALHLTPSWHQLMNRDKAWLHDHYPLVGLRYAAAAAALLGAAVVVLGPIFRRALQNMEKQRVQEQARQLQEHRAWLAAPPQPMAFPSRFTQNWLEANVPSLHPGQVAMLTEEMRARGWPESRISQRLDVLLPPRP